MTPSKLTLELWNKRNSTHVLSKLFVHHWSKTWGSLYDQDYHYYKFLNIFHFPYNSKLLKKLLPGMTHSYKCKDSYWQQPILVSCAWWIARWVQLSPTKCAVFFFKVVRYVRTTSVISWLSICETFISISGRPVKVSQTNPWKKLSGGGYLALLIKTKHTRL